MSMLTCLKVSFLACKSVFYGPENNPKGNLVELNFGGLEMQKWNTPTERAQKLDEKNGVICLFIIFTLPELWSLKCQKWLVFCIFS